MDEKKPSKIEWIYKVFFRFSVAGLLLGIGFLSFALLAVVSRLESLAPAELQLLFEILKNRFYR
jgi:hypothetical protein